MSCSNYQKNKYKNKFKNFPYKYRLEQAIFCHIGKKNLCPTFMMGQKMWRKTISKIIKVALLAMLIFNCQPVGSTRATPSAVMNTVPQDRGSVPPSEPNPRTYLPAPSPAGTTRATPLTVMNTVPQDRGPVRSSEPNPRTYLPAPSPP